MKFQLFLIFISFSLTACYVPSPRLSGYSNGGNRIENGMPSKPGSCFAKCLIPDKVETTGRELALFTGDVNNTDVELVEVEFVTKPGGTEWVKKKADKNCLSANPDDCLVWCLVTTEEEKETYIVVADTSATDQYQFHTREETRLLSSGGYTEWVEVICAGKVTKTLVMDIQNALFAESIYLGAIDGVMGEEAKSALVKFQKKNQLPTGQLDLETLDALGVGY